MVESGLAAALMLDLAGASGRAEVNVCTLPGEPVRRASRPRAGGAGRPAVRAVVDALRPRSAIAPKAAARRVREQ
jgi:hypothetical protein